MIPMSPNAHAIIAVRFYYVILKEKGTSTLKSHDGTCKKVFCNNSVPYIFEGHDADNFSESKFFLLRCYFFKNKSLYYNLF